MKDLIRLQHILESIAFLEVNTKNKGKQILYEDSVLRFAIERQLEIIGEAVNHLSMDLKEKHNSMEWHKIIAFRNFIVHEYFGVDLEIVWNIITTKIPVLKTDITKIIKEEYNH